VRDPRVTKEARTLARAGFSVGVVGLGRDGSAARWDMTEAGYEVFLVPPANRSTMLPERLRRLAVPPWRASRAAYLYLRGRSKQRGTNASSGNPAAQAAHGDPIEQFRIELMGRRAKQMDDNRYMALVAATRAPRVVHAHDL